jgi:hypothetical protein
MSDDQHALALCVPSNETLPAADMASLRTLAPYRRQDPSGQNWGDNHDYLPLGRLLVVLHLELILVLVLDLEVALALVVGAVLLGPTLLTSSLLNLAALVVPDLAKTMESASVQSGERDR